MRSATISSTTGRTSEETSFSFVCDENFGSGNVDPADLVALVVAAGAPVVCETPGGPQGQAADIAWLRARLPEFDSARDLAAAPVVAGEMSDPGL